MKSGRAAKTVPSEVQHHAEAVLSALCVGGELEDSPVLDRLDGSDAFFAEYYASDFDISLPADGKRIAAQLEDEDAAGRELQVIRSASFTRYHDYATRYIHYLLIQPHNTVLTVEGYINNLDWESEAPTVLFGELTIFASRRAAESEWRRLVAAEATEAGRFAVKHLEDALSQLEEGARERLAKRVAKRLEKML